MTWKCHVCGDERPDEKISVYSSKKPMGLVEVTQNVRYCNDRVECYIRSRMVDFLK